MINKILEEYFLKFKNYTFNWADARNFCEIQAETPEWDEFFEEIGDYLYNTLNYEKKLKSYTPGKQFPAISVTGTSCELRCEHCDMKYLETMIQAETPEKFQSNIKKLESQGTIGALISGGSNSFGKVPVLNYEEIIKQFKSNSNFYLNAHVGLVNQSEALRLKECGIDNVSFDLILDQNVISSVFHLPYTVEDYLDSYEALLDSGIRVTPHLLIGANFGKLNRELDIIKVLTDYPPQLLIFIAMIPPKIDGKIKFPFENLTAIDIAKIMFIARVFLPSSEFSLGCMRPKGKISHDIEKWVILLGTKRMEIPSQQTIKWANNQGFLWEYFGACCSIEESFEQYAKASDVRGNLI